jgi:hypothetical protein
MSRGDLTSPTKKSEPHIGLEFIVKEEHLGIRILIQEILLVLLPEPVRPFTGGSDFPKYLLSGSRLVESLLLAAKFLIDKGLVFFDISLRFTRTQSLVRLSFGGHIATFYVFCISEVEGSKLIFFSL